MKKIVLAFSGGLDTSFCIPYLIEQGYEGHTYLSIPEVFQSMRKNIYPIEQFNLVPKST